MREDIRTQWPRLRHPAMMDAATTRVVLRSCGRGGGTSAHKPRHGAVGRGESIPSGPSAFRSAPVYHQDCCLSSRAVISAWLLDWRRCRRRELDTGRCRMKAIVVTDEAAGTAGMTLVERPKPPAAINDVIVRVHASGFVPTEMAWPSTWTDRRDRNRTPSIPGHELAGVVTALGYGTTGCRWDSGCSASRTGIATAP